jgi:hypothetical protein
MAMSKHFSCVIAALLLFFPGSDQTARSAEQSTGLAGKYYGETHYGAKDPLDTVEFFPDGKCVVDLGDGAGGIPGSYHGISDGRLTLEYGKPNLVRTYKAVLKKGSLTLADDSDFEFYFVRRPEPPHPKPEELMGTFRGELENRAFLEIYVYKRTPDHMTETLLRIVSKADKTYGDFHLTSQWNYAGGISIYTTVKTDVPPDFRFICSRDFITRRDEKGIWIINASSGESVCEAPVEKLELPPPPAGYRSPQ